MGSGTGSSTGFDFSTFSFGSTFFLSVFSTGGVLTVSISFCVKTSSSLGVSGAASDVADLGSPDSSGCISPLPISLVPKFMGMPISLIGSGYLSP